VKKLIISGSGIKYQAHLTDEAIRYIENSDIVLFLVNEPLIKEWIQAHNRNTVDLDTIYRAHEKRSTSYIEIATYIIEQCNTYNHVNIVLYGHPYICASPAMEAAKLAKEKGIEVINLPGISSEACLYSDLMINPMTEGAQSFEATDFIHSKRIFDARSHLVLWQVSLIGLTTHFERVNLDGLKALQEHLLNYYPKNHPAIIYEASLYPLIQPEIQKTTLSHFLEKKFTSLSTLYIPPKEIL
jgi:tetrapyrrole methylase family protein / MazG family protein